MTKLQFPALRWKQLGAAHGTRLVGSSGMEPLQGERIRAALAGDNRSFVGKWLEGRLESQPRSGCALARGKRAKNAMGCIRPVIGAGAGEQHAVKSRGFWKRSFPAALWGRATGPPSGPAPGTAQTSASIALPDPAVPGTRGRGDVQRPILGAFPVVHPWNGDASSKPGPVTWRRRGPCSHQDNSAATATRAVPTPYQRRLRGRTGSRGRL